MLNTLLIAHSLMRWLVLGTLGYSIYRSRQGSRNNLPFTKADDSLRHWTATTAHIQLMLGMVLYTQSPIVKYFTGGTGDKQGEPLFFGIIHIALMLVAIVIITIGSAKAKRNATSAKKFKTMLAYSSIGLAIVFIAIPWPFSPLAQRTLIRY